MERTDKIISGAIIACMFKATWEHNVWALVGLGAALIMWKLVGWAAIKEVARDDADQVS